MKQIAKTDQIKEQLRAAFGPDANLDGLAVYSVIALTTLPIRKTYGLLQGARNTQATLAQLASKVNAESRPLLTEHNGSMAPIGRFFQAAVSGEQLDGLIAVDGINHPDIVSKLDSGTIDQVSVNFAPKSLTCSACGYDFLAPGHEMSVFTLTDDKDHVIGQNGVYALVDGVKEFFELSLVGMGGAQGARVRGPSDMQHNEAYRLAASASPGLVCVALSPTLKDPEETMTPEQMAQFSAAVEGKATATAELSATKNQLTAAQEQVTSLTAQVGELTTQLAAANETAAAAQTHKDENAKAVEALTKEATTVLTALSKPVDNLPKDVTALLALIDENRGEFAAIVPPGGKSRTADTENKAPAPPAAAFRAPK